MTNGLELKNLVKEYNKGQPVLKGINLSVPAGSFVSLLGPSGCGKSTVLSCLAGLTDISSGELFFNNSRLDTLPAQKRNVGMVFQNYALFPHLTAYNNVAFGLKIKGDNKAIIDEKVKSALSAMRLSEFSHRYPGELSGGQQQRLAFARTIVMEPKLLLLDEPLSNLDAKLREELKVEIKKLHQKLKVTMVHVTHDQSEAMSMSDIVVLLNKGVVEQAGTPEELYLKPKTLFVADFVGYKNQFVMTVKENSSTQINFKFGEQILTVSKKILDDDQNKFLLNCKIDSKVIAALRPSDLSINSGNKTILSDELKLNATFNEYHGLSYRLSGTINSQNAFVESAYNVSSKDIGVFINWSKARIYEHN